MGLVVDSIGSFIPMTNLCLLFTFLSLTDADFGPVVQPIFISCDPARDTVEQTNAYVKGINLHHSLPFPAHTSDRIHF